MKNLIAILLTSALTFFSISCETMPPSDYPYDPPQDRNDGIPVGTLVDAGIDSMTILQAIAKIHQGRFNEVHSMLVYKDHLLVLEEYFQGHEFQWDAPSYYGNLVNWEWDRPHDTMSVTKSFTSVCIGIAIKEGFIKNVHQSIFDYLPDYQHLKTNNREYITIEHLLTMSSGLAWDEWSVAHGSSANDIDRLWLDCEDPLEFVLEKSWWAVPGDFFTYNGGGMIILAEIIKNATNMRMDAFATKYLFNPLNIESSEWSVFPNGMVDAAGSLKITPRDMLKLGISYLNNGDWDGKQIISPNWVEMSAKPYHNNLDINIPGEDSGKCGYGYTWWTSELSHKGNPIHMYRAGGWGGQEIMVFPDLDMVVVFTGGNYASKSLLYRLVEKNILPATS